MTPRRGQVWTITLDPTIANEQRGTRPCIIVSNSRFNALPIRQVIAVPLTTRERGLPHHVPVDDDGGLTRQSWALCEAVRAVTTQRLGRLIGNVTPATIAAVTEQVALWLADEDT